MKTLHSRKSVFLIGVTVRLVLSIGASKVVPGVRAADPVALVLVALVVGTLARGALTFPARAMVRSGPMRRLRDRVRVGRTSSGNYWV